MARDNRIDSLKGLLIILVVLGHFITTLDNSNIINHAVMGLIYVFHMPLFILVSGYFTKSPKQQTARDLWHGVLNIAITLAVFQLLNSIWVSFAGRDFFKALRTVPFGVLWYLMSLIFWRILLYYTPKPLLRRPWLYLAIALALSILCGLTHLGTFLSLQRTLNFFVFFLLGYYYRQGALNDRWWKNNVLHIATVVVLLPIIFWLFPRCGNVMNGADHYDLSGVPEKALILTCSIAMSLLDREGLETLAFHRQGQPVLFPVSHVHHQHRVPPPRQESRLANHLPVYRPLYRHGNGHPDRDEPNPLLQVACSSDAEERQSRKNASLMKIRC